MTCGTGWNLGRNPGMINLFDHRVWLPVLIPAGNVAPFPTETA